MSQELSAESLLTVNFGPEDARRLIQRDPARVLTEEERGLEGMADDVFGAAGEVHLTVVASQDRAGQYFRGARTAAEQEHADHKAQTDQQHETNQATLTTSYEEALAKLKAEHDQKSAELTESYQLAIRGLDSSLEVAHRTLESKQTRAQNFHRSCDELTETLIGAWQNLQVRHREVVEARVQKIGMLNITEQTLSDRQAELASLQVELSQKYTEWGAGDSAIKIMRSEREAVLYQDQVDDQDREVQLGNVAAIDIRNRQTVMGPEDVYQVVNFEFNDRHLDRVKKVGRIDDEIDLAKQKNELVYCRIVDIRARLDQLAIEQPQLEQQIAELRGNVQELYQQGRQVVASAEEIMADLDNLRTVSQHGVDDNFNVLGKAEQWLADTLSRYQSAIVLTNIVEIAPANDPSSIAGVRFDDVEVPEPNAQMVDDTDGLSRFNSIRDNVQQLLRPGLTKN